LEEKKSFTGIRTGLHLVNGNFDGFQELTAKIIRIQLQNTKGWIKRNFRNSKQQFL